MSATQAAEAHAAGIYVAVEGDDLVLEASAPPSVAFHDLLPRHKAGILTLLRPGRDGWSVEDWWRRWGSHSPPTFQTISEKNGGG